MKKEQQNNQRHIEVAKYNIGDTAHIFMHLKKNNGDIDLSYHFVDHKEGNIDIFVKQGPLDEYKTVNKGTRSLIASAVMSEEERKKGLKEKEILKNIKNVNSPEGIDELFRKIIKKLLSNQEQEKLKKGLKENTDFATALNDIGGEMEKIKLKEDIKNIQQQENSNEDLTMKLINEQKKDEQKHNLQKVDTNKAKENIAQHDKYVALYKQNTEEFGKKLDTILSVKNLKRQEMDVKQYQKQFESIFNESNILSIDLNTCKNNKNQYPLSCEIKLLDKNKQQLCTFTLQHTENGDYKINLNICNTTYTQNISFEAIDEKVTVNNSTQKTIKNIVDLFYNKLSSYFGIEIKNKNIPYVFNVNDIERFTEGQYDYPKHQQGYSVKENDYQLIYEKHTLPCKCDKHQATQINPHDIALNPVLYYGGENDEQERTKKENTFSEYCKKVDDFSILHNQPVDCIKWNNNEVPILNAHAFGPNCKVWRKKHPNWQRQREETETMMLNAGKIDKVVNNHSTLKNKIYQKHIVNYHESNNKTVKGNVEQKVNNNTNFNTDNNNNNDNCNSLFEPMTVSMFNGAVSSVIGQPLPVKVLEHNKNTNTKTKNPEFHSPDENNNSHQDNYGVNINYLGSMKKITDVKEKESIKNEVLETKKSEDNNLLYQDNSLKMKNFNKEKTIITSTINIQHNTADQPSKKNNNQNTTLVGDDINSNTKMKNIVKDNVQTTGKQATWCFPFSLCCKGSNIDSDTEFKEINNNTINTNIHQATTPNQQ